ncbi:hypothetical protein LCGC14_1579740 [marine sediment metagenome]|uniref:Uncharacterized protein n=1 Tax=marine sediment metagenome TaxID=412755 RepID=A0A0F9KY40_9ZZZZ
MVINSAMIASGFPTIVFNCFAYGTFEFFNAAKIFFEAVALLYSVIHASIMFFFARIHTLCIS